MKGLASLVRIILSTVVIGAVFSFAAARQQGPNAAEKTGRDLEEFFEAALDELHLAGMSVSIVKGDRVVWEDGFGMADIERNVPADPGVLFHQGSVSKTVTAAALLRLREQARFTLADDINRYLPFAVRNPRHPDVPITLRMLLTHTSSISDVSSGHNRLSGLNEGRDSETPVEEVLKGYLIPDGKYYTEENFSAYAPGEHYEYSNLSFALIGYLVERISGEPFTDYCRKHIVDPLEMKETTWRLSEVKPGRFAYQYRPSMQSPTGFIKVLPYTWPGYMDGSLRTSASEYANFLIMLLNQGQFRTTQVLRPETVDLFLSPQHVKAVSQGGFLPPVDRAIVWTISRLGSDTVYHFNGFGTGFVTEVFFIPSKKLAGTVFITGEVNSMPVLGDALRRMVTKKIDDVQSF